ncbi:hypothetical protein ACKWTF_016074 [Chironomus riparius]
MNKNILLSLAVLIFTVSKCYGQLDRICDGTATVEIIPHPDDCTKYVICILQMPSIVKCEPDTVFNYLTDSCEPGNPETCTIYSMTTTTTLKPPTETTTELPIYQCPPDGIVLIPNYSNCRRYFSCHFGERHLHFCPIGLFFDSVDLKCKIRRFAVCAGAEEY